MAGAGWRRFQPGEVLTASNLQTYGIDQSVQVYAGTAARGSAIGTAVSEGMLSYLQDLNTVQFYDGSSWRPFTESAIVAGTAARGSAIPAPIQGDTVYRTDAGYFETYYGTSTGGLDVAGWYRSGGAIKHTEWTTSQTSATNAGLSNVGTITKDTTNSNSTLATYSSGIFTISEPGFYSISWFGKATAGVTTGRTFCLLYGNGSVELDFNDVNSSENIYLGVSYSNYFALTAGHTFEIQIFQTSGATRTVNGRLRLTKLG